MHSVIKPLKIPSQTLTSENQANKTTHVQGSATSYGQTSHMSQNLNIRNMHPNTTVAHSQSNQQHPFSLNASNSVGHYINQNLGQIPASNHPIANPSSTAAGQGYGQEKNGTNNCEVNLTYQNQNAVPITQALTATSSTNSVGTISENSNQPQSAKSHLVSTSDAAAKTPPKTENPTDFSPALVPEKKVPQATVGTVDAKTPEKKENASSLSSPDKEKRVPVASAESKSPQKNENAASTAQENRIQPAPVPQVQPSPPARLEPVKIEPTKLTIVNSNQPTTVENHDKPEKVTTSVNLIAKEPEAKTPEAKESVVTLPKAISEENLLSAKQSPTSTAAPPASSPAVPPTSDISSKAVKKKLKPQESSKADGPSRLPKEPKLSAPKLTPISNVKRQRIRTQPYQSPLPEVELISKISSMTPRTAKSGDKLIVFYKNEFLAVRNAEGSFYLCQALQNIYKSSSKIKIRWLSQDKNDKSGEIYIPDFYDLTEFDCILTNLSLNRADKGKFKLPPSEKERTQSILNRSLAVEKGEATIPSVTEEHPDGLDLSLYRDEEQLKKRKTKKRKAGRKSLSSSPKSVAVKKSPEAPKVRKAASALVKTPAKTPAVQKAPQPVKKIVAQPVKQKSSSIRSTGRSKREVETKTSPIMDQKKAKVLAKIGRKTIPATKTVETNGKSAKPTVSKPVPGPSKKEPLKKISSSMPSTSSATSRQQLRNARRLPRKQK